jgi:hypothetical protein
MQFVLLAQHTRTLALVVVCRGPWAHCQRLKRLLPDTLRPVGTVWVPAAERAGLVAATAADPDGPADDGPADDGGELPPASPENAGTRHAVLPFLRIADPAAN